MTSALLTKLDEARHQLAAPFAPERVDLVARVAETLLGSRRVDRLRACRPFRLLDPSRRARQARGELCRARAAEHAGATARPRLSSAAAECRDGLSLFVGARPIWPATPISCACRMRSARVCRRSSISFSNGSRPRETMRRLFVHYPSQGDLGAKISALSDARVVWGGDAKVALFAPLPLRNGGKSIWFGDRFSFSTINGAALDKLDDAALKALAKKLHNDVFVFDQMACSSPHALYVVGDAATHSAGGSAPARRIRARVDHGRSRGPCRTRDRQDDGRVLRRREPDAPRRSTGGTRT